MNIYLVALIIIAIVVLANLSTFIMLRGSRNMKFGFLNPSKNGLSQPFKKENDQLNELRQRIKNLSQDDDQPDQLD